MTNEKLTSLERGNQENNHKFDLIRLSTLTLLVLIFLSLLYVG